MSKRLVIVESPAKARTLTRILGKGYVVKASMGHVRDLPKKRLGIEIEKDFEPSYQTIRGKGDVVKQLKRAADGADEVFLAPDLDREGEAIAWHLFEALSLDDAKTRRVTFHEITPEAVRASFARPGRISMDKVNAQQTRRILDRLVGYHLSPLLWKKVGRGLSAGRVQSVAVKLIVDREREVEAFKAEEYWEVEALLSTERAAEPRPEACFAAKLAKVDGASAKLASETDAKAILARIEHERFLVRRVAAEEKHERPLPPFATAELQQQASIRLRFSAKKTMRVAQQLYEGIPIGDEGPVGLITYMRTDSYHVAESAQKECRAFVEKRFGAAFVPEKPNRFRAKGSAQEAHEAVRPTHAEQTPESLESFLDPDQLKLYRLVWQRFVASQMSPARVDVTEVDVAAGPALFEVRGRRILFRGYLEVWPFREGEEQVLPAMKEGQEVFRRGEGLVPTQHFTQPPPRYSEATLVKALEKKGIGRPSTYAAILSTIRDRGYVEMRKRRFHPTDLGKVVTDLLVQHFEDLINEQFTSTMEGRLDRIEEAKEEWRPVLREFYAIFAADLEKAKAEMKGVKGKAAEVTDEPCPTCGAPLVKRLSRGGWFLGCSRYPECKGTKPMPGQEGEPEETVEASCLKCRSPMVLRRGRWGRFVACSAYPGCRNSLSIRDDGQAMAARMPPVPTDEKCEKCGKPMVIRRGRRGPFLGCTGYPRCRGTKPLPDALRDLARTSYAANLREQT
jgi:DNA topoisomerase-1